MVCLREWLCAGGGYSMPMFQCGVDKCWSRNVGPHASGSRRVCVRACECTYAHAQQKGTSASFEEMPRALDIQD